MKFYHCKKCNTFIPIRKTKEGHFDATFPSRLENLVEFMKGEDKFPICCGEEMELLTPNTVDASLEKHVPVVKLEGDVVEVRVGELEHPMTEEHHLDFVVIETLNSRNHTEWPHFENNKPEVKYKMRKDLWPDEKPLRVYAYCNLHGLWVKEL